MEASNFAPGFHFDRKSVGFCGSGTRGSGRDMSDRLESSKRMRRCRAHATR